MSTFQAGGWRRKPCPVVAMLVPSPRDAQFSEKRDALEAWLVSTKQPWQRATIGGDPGGYRIFNRTTGSTFVRPNDVLAWSPESGAFQVFAVENFIRDYEAYEQ